MTVAHVEANPVRLTGARVLHDVSASAGCWDGARQYFAILNAMWFELDADRQAPGAPADSRNIS